MAVNDYNKLKKLEVTSQNDQGTTQDKAQALLLAGTESKTVQDTDGFEDGDFTSNPSWNNVTASTATVQSSTVKRGDNSLEVSSGKVEHDRGANDGISDGDTYSSWVYFDSVFADYGLTNTSATLAGGDDAVVISSGGESGNGVFETHDSSGNLIASTDFGSGVLSAGNWYRYEIVFDVTNSQVTGRLYDSNNNLLQEITGQSYSGASNIQYVSVENQPDLASNNTFFDNVSFSATDTTGLDVDGEEGTGDIVLDWTNISSESDIAIYDQNGNLLPYEIESFDATAETATLWCYNSWTRDDSVQAQVVYGDGPASSEENVTGTWNNTGQNLLISHRLNNLQDSGPNDATLTNNGATQTTVSNFDGAYDFDPTDDYMTWTDSATDLSGESAFTVVSWQQIDSDTGSNQDIIHFGGFELIQGYNPGDDDLIFYHRNSGSTTYNIKLGNPISNHFGEDILGVQTYDGSTKTAYVGIDNLNSQSISASGSVIANPQGGVTASLGRKPSDATRFLDGKIGDFRIYNSSKSNAWIQAEYDASPKAGQVYFSQQAAETTSLEIAAETSTVTASNPEPGVNATGSTTIQGQASTLTSSNPNPSVNPSGTVTITAQQSTLTASTPNASVNGTGTATLNAQTSTLTASTPEPGLTEADAINAPVSTITTSNPEPQISGTGNTDLNAETSTLTTTIPQPTIDATGTTTIQAQESSLQSSNPEPQISGSGTVTVQAEESSLNIFNPEPNITIPLEPRDTSFTTSIKTETDKTLSGDIDK